MLHIGVSFMTFIEVRRAENGFPTQAYSSFTISALREAFSSKVTPVKRSSCTRLHPNAFDKDSENSRYNDVTDVDSLRPIIIYTIFSAPPSLSTR